MSNLPAHKVKIGLITATVWNNDGHYSVDLSRSYKSDDEWKTSTGFFQADLLNVAKCVERAEVWIARQIETKSNK